MFNSFFYLIGQGFKNLWKNSLMTLASIGVLLSCMLIIGVAVLFTVNVATVIDVVEEQSEAIIFLEDDVTDTKIEDIKNSVIATGKIASIEFISKDDALRDMMDSLGDDGILFDAYTKNDSNNLPNSFRVTFDDVSNLRYTVSVIENIDGVLSVSALTEVADVITGLKNMVSIGGMAVIALLIAVSLMIIGNTIRITIFSRKREINIMKYVGATNTFIQFPFIVEGAMIGIISGLLSYGIIYFAYDYLTKWVMSNQGGWFSMLVSSIVPFSTIGLQMLVGFVGGGALIGIIGCVISSGKYTKV